MNTATELASKRAVQERCESDYLPAIDIAIREAPRVFLERVAQIAETSGSFAVERHYDALGRIGFHVLNLRHLKRSPHNECGAQLISSAPDRRRIEVEMRARRWTPDPPTYDVYCGAARVAVNPMLAAYNNAYASRYRLRVTRQHQLKAKLPLRSERLFKKFVLLANTATLHPFDWRRFYEFVRASRVQMHEDDLSYLLVSEGFGRPQADRIATIYRHLYAFKRLR